MISIMKSLMIKIQNLIRKVRKAPSSPIADTNEKIDISNKVEHELDEIVDMYSEFRILPFQAAEALLKNTIGAAYIELGEYEKAEKYLLEVVKIWPECFQAYHNLGKLYYDKGEYDKAEEMFKKEKFLLSIIPKYTLRPEKRNEFREQFRKAIEEKHKKHRN